MSKIKDKLNKKSKGEQLFILIISCMALFGLLCVSGCGGQSCETPQCGSRSEAGISAKGCSIPGLGGILSSGKGCNSPLWAQSCKTSCGTVKDETSDDGGCIWACDTRYYGGGCGCLGCGQSDKSCYSSCVNWTEGDTKAKGIFYGTSDSGEHVLGCYNGCAGCVGSDTEFLDVIRSLETMEGID